LTGQTARQDKEDEVDLLNSFNRRLNNFFDEVEAAVEELEEAVPELRGEEEAALKMIIFYISNLSSRLADCRDSINEIRTIHNW